MAFNSSSSKMRVVLKGITKTYSQYVSRVGPKQKTHITEHEERVDVGLLRLNQFNDNLSAAHIGCFHFCGPRRRVDGTMA